MVISENSVVLRIVKNSKSYVAQAKKKEAIINEKDEILDLNREELRHGTDAEGEKFGPYKAAYARYKQRLASYKARYPTPDLYVTGELQDRMFLWIVGKKVHISSKDPETLIKTAGRFADAFGISPNIAMLVMEIVTDEFNNLSYKHLFAK